MGAWVADAGPAANSATSQEPQRLAGHEYCVPLVLLGSLLLVGLIDIALMLWVPSYARARPTAPHGSGSLHWWTLQVSLLGWIVLIVGVSWRRLRAHMPFVILIALLTLNYLAIRPGGWYSNAAEDPIFDLKQADGYGTYDAEFYWKAALDYRSGLNPFKSNWYPPTFLKAFYPLCTVAPRTAFAIWWLIVCLSYLSCVILTYGVGLDWGCSRLESAALAGIMWLHNQPALATARELQVNLIILSLLLLGYLVLSKHPLISGVATAVATTVKGSPVLLALLMGAAGSVAWIASFVVALSALVGITMFGDGPGLWSQFFVTLADKRWDSASLDSIFAWFWRGGQAALVIALLVKLAILIWATSSILAFRRAIQRRNQPLVTKSILQQAAFAVGCCCMVLVAPVIWDYHRVWFVPALLFVWRYGNRRLLAPLLGVTALLIWLPAVSAVNFVSSVVPGLFLMWCIRPGMLAGFREESALTYVIHSVGDWLCRQNGYVNTKT